MSPMTAGATNELLGYAPDARLLILNGDDLGLCHAVNAGVFQTLTRGVVCSTTLMVPCPWAAEAMSLLADRLDIPNDGSILTRWRPCVT